MSQITTIDVRTIMPRERHALIFQTFDNMPVGATIELVNDHDPVPLHHQFASIRADRFSWQYLQQGPDLWRVHIGKSA